jgi:hypothetical protein
MRHNRKINQTETKKERTRRLTAEENKQTKENCKEKATSRSPPLTSE